MPNVVDYMMRRSYRFLSLSMSISLARGRAGVGSGCLWYTGLALAFGSGDDVVDSQQEDGSLQRKRMVVVSLFIIQRAHLIIHLYFSVLLKALGISLMQTQHGLSSLEHSCEKSRRVKIYFLISILRGMFFKIVSICNNIL